MGSCQQTPAHPFFTSPSRISAGFLSSPAASNLRWIVADHPCQCLCAFQLHREISNEWLLGLSGLASVLFGILLMAMPGAGTLAIVWLIGVYAILFGILLLGLAYRLHQLGATIIARRRE